MSVLSVHLRFKVVIDADVAMIDTKSIDAWMEHGKSVKEPDMAIVVRAGASMFLPPKRQRYALALQLARNQRPIRFV